MARTSAAILTNSAAPSVRGSQPYRTRSVSGLATVLCALGLLLSTTDLADSTERHVKGRVVVPSMDTQFVGACHVAAANGMSHSVNGYSVIGWAADDSTIAGQPFLVTMLSFVSTAPETMAPESPDRSR